jgi:hypothetical protein
MIAVLDANPLPPRGEAGNSDEKPRCVNTYNLQVSLSFKDVYFLLVK